MRKSHWHQAVHITLKKIATSRRPPLKSYYSVHQYYYVHYLRLDITLIKNCRHSFAAAVTDFGKADYLPELTTQSVGCRALT